VRSARRRPRWWLLLGGTALAGLVWWRGATRGPAAEIRAELGELARAVSAPPGADPAERERRIRAVVERSLAPDAVLDVEEAPGLGAEPGALARALTGLVAPGEASVVELTAIEVEVRGDVARAIVDARLGADVGRDLHARQRRLSLRLVRRDGRWRVVAAGMHAATDPEPEARP